MYINMETNQLEIVLKWRATTAVEELHKVLTSMGWRTSPSELTRFVNMLTSMWQSKDTCANSLFMLAELQKLCEDYIQHQVEMFQITKKKDETNV